MFSRTGSAALAALLTVSLPAWAQVVGQPVNIDFENTGAPCCFVDTVPLTNQYADLGVTFAGVDGVGGSILNRSGSFVFGGGHSGTDFLAFNLSVTPMSGDHVEAISFNAPVSNVSIWAAAGDVAGNPVYLKAFDVEGHELGQTSLGGTFEWQQLSLNLSGISRVELSAPQNAVFAYDDLSFTAAVPEVGTSSMMLVGLGAVGCLIGRRRQG